MGGAGNEIRRYALPADNLTSASHERLQSCGRTLAAAAYSGSTSICRKVDTRHNRNPPIHLEYSGISSAEKAAAEETELSALSSLKCTPVDMIFATGTVHWFGW